MKMQKELGRLDFGLAKIDREWAALWANRDWSNSIADYLMKAMEMKLSHNVSIAAIRNLPLEYVKKNASLLSEVVPVDLCIRLGKSEHIDITKYDLNILEYLYCSAEIGYEIPESQAEIEQRFFAFLHQICADYDYKKCLHPISIMTIPMIGKAIQGLGVHGMTDVLMHIIDLIQYVYNGNRNLNWYEEFDRVVRWIQCEWDMENKEYFINMICLDDDCAKEDETNSNEDTFEFHSYYKSNVNESDLDEGIRDFINELY